jgi:hypothetical protein
MKPRTIYGWIARRNVDTDDDGELVTTVILEFATDRGPHNGRLMFVIDPEVAANIGWDLIGEGAAFAYNTPVDVEGDEG